MKKVAFIVVCIIGLVGFSSCKSTSKSCGLAKNTKQTKQVNQQVFTVSKATVK